MYVWCMRSVPLLSVLTSHSQIPLRLPTCDECNPVVPAYLGNCDDHRQRRDCGRKVGIYLAKCARHCAEEYLAEHYSCCGLRGLLALGRGLLVVIFEVYDAEAGC